ncbi:MAG: class I SAM-dependent methyltransferase, partial [Chloroflexota bacterium]
RRTSLARGIVRVLRTSILDPSSLDVVLDEDMRERGSLARGADRTRLVIRGPDTLAHLLFPPSADAFADAYLRGDLDIEGDVTAAVAAAGSLDPRRLRATGIRRLFRWGIELRRGTPAPRPLVRVAGLSGRRHSRARDMEAVRFHYDVGEAFYESWLDRRLTYSCGYFPDGTADSDAATVLDEAQDAKLGLIARKLRVKASTRLLDIGSGWGSLVQFVAEQHGVEAVGVTLSQQQSDEANSRLHDAGLAHLARTEVRDYRDLAELGSFDVIASVGMFEHVGQAHLSAYFGAAYEVLQPGGLFLNHGIATARRMGSRLCRGGPASPGRFVERYVFPDGELVTIEEAVRVARRAGFEVIDVQSLRPHYALTLAAWVARLEDRWSAAVAAAGEEVARTWRLYLSAARLGFEQGNLDVYQMLLAKPVGHGVPAKLPLRPWW